MHREVKFRAATHGSHLAITITLTLKHATTWIPVESEQTHA